MTLGIMQPYWLPYIGYWQLLNAVDKYVVYDDMAYIKGGWITRNNFLIQGNSKLLTFSIKKASSYKLINEISINDDFSNFHKTLQINYSKAPYFVEVSSLLKDITSFDKNNLALFLYNSIKKTCEYLEIKTTLILSSEIKKNNSLKGKDKVIHICKLLNAQEYYNSIGGQELYSKDEFLNNGIELHFLKPHITEYKQFKNNFVPSLSIVDVMMFNSRQTVRKMLDEFELA